MPRRQPDEAGSACGPAAGRAGMAPAGSGQSNGHSNGQSSPQVMTVLTRPKAEPNSKGEPKAKPSARRTLWRRTKRITRGWRVAAVERAPPWMRRVFGPLAWYVDMLLIDHGIFRLIYVNRHRLSDEAWRSAQPAPHHIRALRRRGLRTIVNLRGERLCGSYWLEQAACERKGIKLVNFQLRSRAAPTVAEIRAARDLLERIEYPVLLHCKSGADRVGLMSALYRVFREGEPPAEAKRELSLRYGHVRQADTGILDRFFEKYLEDNKLRPMPFMDWVETVYDPEALKREFRASGWARRLVDQILKRE
jgi:protein tyrosine/serine phosphatase